MNSPPGLSRFCRRDKSLPLQVRVNTFVQDLLNPMFKLLIQTVILSWSKQVLYLLFNLEGIDKTHRLLTIDSNWPFSFLHF